MALTRARIVAGDARLAAKVEAGIKTRFTTRRDAALIRRDARQMREKIAVQYPGHDVWDLKYAPGGLIDIEFIVQALQLIHAPDGPAILDTNIVAALDKIARAGLLDAADAGLLLGTAKMEQALPQILR